MGKRGCVGCSCALAVVLLALGLLLLPGSGVLMREIERRFMALRNGSFSYPDFVDIPIPIYTDVYFFNVTNPYDVTNRGAKPHLVEMGPYVYEQRVHRKNITFNDNNGTVTFEQTRTYHFVPEKSNGSEADVVCTISAPAAGANGMGANAWYIEQHAIDRLLGDSGEPLFLNQTVGELLFKGFHDKFFDHMRDVGFDGIPDKFGYFYGRNDTTWSDGVINMHTGVDSVSNMSVVARFNNSDRFPGYPGECGRVRGTGDTVPPGQKKTRVDIFAADMCRPISMEYDGETVKDDLTMYQFRMTDMYFANKTKNPANWCYDPNGRGLPSGVYDAGPCMMAAHPPPALMSQPHFYQADPFYLDQIASGLSPQKEKHETRYLVEPVSGVPAKINARFQINFLLESSGVIYLFMGIRAYLYVPALWFEIRAEAPDHLMDRVKVLGRLQGGMELAGAVLLVAGAALVVAMLAAEGAALVYRRRGSTGFGVLDNESEQEDFFQEDQQQEQEQVQSDVVQVVEEEDKKKETGKEENSFEPVVDKRVDLSDEEPLVNLE